MDCHKLAKQGLAVVTAVCLIILGSGGTANAGIQGSGFRAMAAVGRILQVDGGLIVNGVQYSTDGARVTIDGRVANLSELRPGDVVTINGSLSTDGTTAIADEIAFVGDVRGVVTASDPQSGTLTVMNQTIRLTHDTVLNGAATLAVGDAVEVSGFANSAGELVASSVQVQKHAAKGQVRGTVAALDTNAHTFFINSLLIDYDVKQVEGTLANGAVAVVESKSESSSGGVLVAKRVKVSQALGVADEQGDLQGLITAFVSDAEFELNGQHVIGDEHTRYTLRGQLLGPDSEGRVSGRFAADGSLLADSIEITQVGKGRN